MIPVKMKRGKIYEGKAKILFDSKQPGTLVQHFKDDATAFNNQKKGTIEGKGVLNNMISEFIMLRLADMGVPTHFIKRINMREQLIKKVEIIPLEVVIRNIAAGSMCKRLGIEEGRRLDRPIVEFYLKDDSLGDPIVTEEHIFGFDWATPFELNAMVNMAIRINDFMCGLFAGIGLRLVDFKLEFGRQDMEDGSEPQIILADEISPDNCRLWDVKTDEKMDKDRFRQGLGGEAKAYQEVARRLGVFPGEKAIDKNNGNEPVPANDSEGDSSDKEDI